MEKPALTELVAPAVTIACSKQERPNWHAEKDYVNPIVTDWVIDEILINGMDLELWWTSVVGGEPHYFKLTSNYTEATNRYNRKSCRFFKTKKQALQIVIEEIVEVLDRYQPDWEWGEGEEENPGWFAAIKSLEGK